MSQESSAEMSNKKQFFMWGGIVLAIVGLIYGLSLFGSNNTSPAGKADLTTSGITDHIKGAEDSVVTLIEYSDFQCPACKSYEPVVQQLTEYYGDTITFVYRHFPLRSIHRNAQLAGQASEAAGLQGKFWEMHDVLFAEQSRWANSANPQGMFEDYAEQLGLDVEQFKTDIESDDVIGKVNKDYRTGNQAGISGTPSFVLNGERITSNPRSLEEFRAIIDPLLGDQVPEVMEESLPTKDASDQE